MALYGVKDIGKSIVRNDIKEIKQMGTFLFSNSFAGFAGRDNTSHLIKYCGPFQLH
jgi:hypothetical protein